jgi:hypothetical protein
LPLPLALAPSPRPLSPRHCPDDRSALLGGDGAPCSRRRGGAGSCRLPPPLHATPRRTRSSWMATTRDDRDPRCHVQMTSTR